VFFAWHTLWPAAIKTAPFSGQFEWFSALLGVTAFIALWRYQAGVVKVIGACALLGLSYSMLA